MSGKRPELSSVTTPLRRSPIPGRTSNGLIWSRTRHRNSVYGAPSQLRPHIFPFCSPARCPCGRWCRVSAWSRFPAVVSPPCRAADISRRVATGQAGGSRCPQVRPLTPGMAESPDNTLRRRSRGCHDVLERVGRPDVAPADDSHLVTVRPSGCNRLLQPGCQAPR